MRALLIVCALLVAGLAPHPPRAMAQADESTPTKLQGYDEEEAYPVPPRHLDQPRPGR